MGVELEPTKQRLQLPIFAEGGDVLEYIDKLEQYFGRYDVEEKVAHFYFTFTLKGKPLQWYKTLGKRIEPEAGESKYQARKEALLEAYGPNKEEDDFFDWYHGYSEADYYYDCDVGDEEVVEKEAVPEKKEAKRVVRINVIQLKEPEGKRGRKRKVEEITEEYCPKRAKVERQKEGTKDTEVSCQEISATYEILESRATKIQGSPENMRTVDEVPLVSKGDKLVSLQDKQMTKEVVTPPKEFVITVAVTVQYPQCQFKLCESAKAPREVSCRVLKERCRKEPTPTDERVLQKNKPGYSKESYLESPVTLRESKSRPPRKRMKA